jgi:hypothetical protein
MGYIDHINGVRDDNRIENLRDVSASENSKNVVHGRWANTLATRKESDRLRKLAERERKAAEREGRERALLAKLKAKYEG